MRPARAQNGHTNAHASPAAAKSAGPRQSSAARAAEKRRHQTGGSHALPSAPAATATTTTQNNGTPGAPSPTDRARKQPATACTQAESDDPAALPIAYGQKPARNVSRALVSRSAKRSGDFSAHARSNI